MIHQLPPCDGSFWETEVGWQFVFELGNVESDNLLC